MMENQKLKLLKVEDILKLNQLKFYYKYKNGSLPKYFPKRQEHDLNSIRTENQFILRQNFQLSTSIIQETEITCTFPEQIISLVVSV